MWIKYFQGRLRCNLNLAKASNLLCCRLYEIAHINQISQNCLCLNSTIKQFRDKRCSRNCCHPIKNYPDLTCTRTWDLELLPLTFSIYYTFYELHMINDGSSLSFEGYFSWFIMRKIIWFICIFFVYWHKNRLLIKGRIKHVFLMLVLFLKMFIFG
jgi:hypothetical protein